MWPIFTYEIRSSFSLQFEFRDPVSTEYTPTDGTLAPNTSKDGLVGPIWRVKYTVVGTYTEGTILRVDAFAQGVTSFP